MIQVSKLIDNKKKTISKTAKYFKKSNLILNHYSRYSRKLWNTPGVNGATETYKKMQI